MKSLIVFIALIYISSASDSIQVVLDNCLNPAKNDINALMTKENLQKCLTTNEAALTGEVFEIVCINSLRSSATMRLGQALMCIKDGTNIAYESIKQVRRDTYAFVNNVAKTAMMDCSPNFNTDYSKFIDCLLSETQNFPDSIVTFIKQNVLKVTQN
ncbi:hypothetical protein PVAND_013324 [Polypedilum vanderplanki]|uniref:Uncharacterized protein n=1 Tax=Polypedilum vanderplanki TaxID=319348 RepID=A0A9J6CR70_POLVA|nr:hypothetical protein PVAND_013324 [Polypedilum vanderplanki]